MKKIVIAILFLIISVSAFGQKFYSTVDESKVGESDRFQLTLTFEGKDVNKLSNFSPPSLKDFRVLSGPNQSTSMQIINGAVSASISFSYILLPNSTGSFTIGSASIDYEGETYKTDPIKITVVQGTSKPKQETQQGISNEEIAKNLFIRASIDKNKAYQGEQVTVTYKLYTRLNIAAQMSVNKLPQYQGFWAEELETSNNINFATEVIDGKQYRVGILKRAALFATQTGNLEVTPLELTVPVQVQKKRNPNNVWDDFFGDPFGRGETIEFKAKSNILKVQVLPLPEKNKPENFNGAVGSYDFTASLDKSSTVTNEPITLKMRISGKGNIKLIELPSFELPTGFEKYDPKTNEQINRSGIISGMKEAEYLFVPRIAGTREINPIEFSYFDPQKKNYVTLKSKPFSIKIEQGKNIPSVNVASKEEISQLDNDIRFIKTSFSDIHRKRELLLYNPIFWILIILPLFTLVGVVLWKRKQDKLSGNITQLKFSKAQKIAKARFKSAKKLMALNNAIGFYSELSQALFGYLEDKFKIPKAEFSLDRTKDELLKNNFSEDFVERVKQSVEKCEFIRFAPGSDKQEAKQDMYDEFSSLIIEIEKKLG